MARRKKTDGKLIALALVLAPVIWLHERVGTTGIVILIVVILAVAIAATASRKAKKNTSRAKAKPTAKRTRGSKNSTTIAIPADKIDDVLAALDRVDTTDYLGQAAEAGQKAKAAAADGDFDGAWKLYHEQKNLYLQHANRSGFTPVQAIALEGSVHRNLANLLRKENRHGEALVHYLYCYATSPRRTKTDEKQLGPYVNRAKINASIEDVQKFAASLGPIPNFRAIQTECQRWAQSS